MSDELIFKELLDEPPGGWPEVRECHTAKCYICGKFTKQLHPVWIYQPYPEILYEVGDCCRGEQ